MTIRGALFSANSVRFLYAKFKIGKQEFECEVVEENEEDGTTSVDVKNGQSGFIVKSKKLYDFQDFPLPQWEK